MPIECYHTMGIRQWEANQTRLDKENTRHLNNVRKKHTATLGAIISSLLSEKPRTQRPKSKLIGGLDTSPDPEQRHKTRFLLSPHQDL